MKLPLSTLAPAKVNLCLYVGGRRDDGLHEICSIFQAVSLADEITAEEGAGADEVVCPGVTGDNLALLALERFRAELGLEEPALRITIRKQIPVAAGLGGGSADAGAVLRICAALRAVDPGDLNELAMSLGADVPSQLDPGLLLVTGAGERLEPLDRPAGLSLVLLMNQRGLSTADVYARADELGLPDRDLTRIGNELREKGAEPEVLHNDLQRAALELEPTGLDALELLRESGAERALMSGSGPTAFGVFSDRSAAERAASGVSSRWGGTVSVVEPVSEGYAKVTSRSGSGQ